MPTLAQVNGRLRSRLCAEEPEELSDSKCEHGHGRPSGGGRSRYRPWRELLARTFRIDLACKGCGKRMKLKAFVTSPGSLSRLCTRVGDPTSPPERAPARGPPYFDYGVAFQSRTKSSPEPRKAPFYRCVPDQKLRQRAVEIDYSRSHWRTGGCPLTGCNRHHEDVGAESTPGAKYTHSPPLDSRCSAPGRLREPVEICWQAAAKLHGGARRARILWFVPRPVAPQCVQHASEFAGSGNCRDVRAPALSDPCCPD